MRYKPFCNKGFEGKNFNWFFRPLSSLSILVFFFRSISAWKKRSKWNNTNGKRLSSFHWCHKEEHSSVKDRRTSNLSNLEEKFADFYFLWADLFSKLWTESKKWKWLEGARLDASVFKNGRWAKMKSETIQGFCLNFRIWRNLCLSDVASNVEMHKIDVSQRKAETFCNMIKIRWFLFFSICLVIHMFPMGVPNFWCEKL